MLRRAAPGAPSLPASYTMQPPPGDRTTMPQPCPMAAASTRSPGVPAPHQATAAQPTTPTRHQAPATAAQVTGRRRCCAGTRHAAVARQAYQPITHQNGGPGTQTWPHGTAAPISTTPDVAARAASHPAPHTAASESDTVAARTHANPSAIASGTSGATITLSTIPTGLTT